LIKNSSNSTMEKPWSKVPKQFKLEKTADKNSLVVNDIKNSDKKMDDEKYVKKTDELFDVKRNKIIRDIDTINKHVIRKEIEIRKLNDANADLVKKNNELKQISEEFKKKYQEELKEKLSVVQDNQKLAFKMQQIISARGDSTDDKKYEMLVATIKDKDTKLVKLTELIAPLRKRVKEQEGLVDELTLVKSEKKGLMEVNEEIVREIASLNDRHLKAISSKDKQLAMLQEKSSRLMSETKRILEEEKSDFAGQGSKLALERKRVEELKRSVSAERMGIEDIKTALIEEKKIIEDSKRLIDEENDIIEEEKRIIDEEWGDIGRKKKEISEAENEFSEKVKALMEENEKVAVEKSMLEVELTKAHEELRIDKGESKSEDTINEILQQNESAIKSLESENVKNISELNKKEKQISVLKNRLDKQEDNLKTTELKLNEEISIKDGMIQDLEFQVSQQKSKEKEEFSRHKEEIDRLKVKIGVLNNNNKRRRSDEQCCNNSPKKLKPLDETIDVVVMQEVVADKEGGSVVDEDLNTEEVLIDEIIDKQVDSDEIEELTTNVGTDIDILVSEDYNAAVEVMTSTTIEDADTEVSASQTLSPANNESNENEPVEVDISEDGAAPETDPALANDASDSEAVKDPSALKLIEAMNDFESLIKSSRNQDTLVVKEVAQPDEPATESAPELNKANQLIKQVEDIIGQTKIINIINTAKKTESIRDVFDDSDEESENEVTIADPSPDMIQEVVDMPTPQTIKVRDMTSICESKDDSVANDVIIPTNSGDISIEISEEDETVKKKALEDAGKLKSQVTDVVKLSLNKFFQIVDGVQTKEDLESLIARFSNHFSEEIISSHLEKNASAAGITMTRDHKRSLVDQIIFYFEIKKSVNMNLRKHIHPSSPQFVTLSSDLSNQFSKDIMESHRTMFNSLTGLALTPDNHQWIGNNINFKMSSSQK